MKRVISISEVVGAWDTVHGCREVCATAEAGYDERNSSTSVQLDSFLRPAGGSPLAGHESPDWLPRKCTLIETVPRAEAALLAREAFQSWVRQVRRAIPPAVHPQPTETYDYEISHRIHHGVQAARPDQPSPDR